MQYKVLNFCKNFRHLFIKVNFASKRGQRLLAGFAEREQSQVFGEGLKVNFASKREQRPLAGFAEREQSQVLGEGLKVNFASKREQRPLAGFAEREQMMVQTECRAKCCLSYAEVPPIQAAGKSSPEEGLKVN